MKTVAKKILATIVKIITWLLVVFTVFMMVFTIFTVMTVDKNDQNFLGFKFYIVQTDSMSLSENNGYLKVHFSAGDVIIIKEVEDATAFRTGDIIAFVSTNSESYGETITHMIRKVQKDRNGNVEGYVTYGTNTGADDEALVEPGYVLGTYSGKIPGAGYLFTFVKSTAGYIVCILIPFLLLILYNGINVIRLSRKQKREQKQALQAEKDQIAADRTQVEYMMNQLLALKTDLEKKIQ